LDGSQPQPERGVAFLYDEAHTIYDRPQQHQFPLGALIGAFVQTQDDDAQLPVMLVRCGLPPLVTNLQRARSHAERLFRAEELGNLSLTGVRADAEVVAITPRGSSERIPAGATRLSLTSTARGGRPIRIATVTSPAKIRTLIALLDGLPLLPPDHPFECGPSVPEPVQLAFYARRGGAPLATASFEPYPTTSTWGWCSTVGLTIDGRAMQLRPKRHPRANARNLAVCRPFNSGGGIRTRDLRVMSPQTPVLRDSDYAVLQGFRCSELTPVLLKLMPELMPDRFGEQSPVGSSPYLPRSVRWARVSSFDEPVLSGPAR
jgi:hypothetical protein